MSSSTAYLRYQLRLVIIVISALFLHQSAFGQTVILRVDGDIPSAGGDGTGWGDDAFKYLQDALAEAAAQDPGTTVHLWVAATDVDNPYWPDRDAANEDGTGDRNATFRLDFNNVQLLGGFFGDETDPDDRAPAVNITVLSGEITFPLEDVCGPGNGPCFVPNNTPGCEDAACCDLVCNLDPLCCLVGFEWTQSCADLAKDNCTGDELPYGAYHVVTAVDVDETVRIDGFTITMGSAGGGGATSRGGGMFIDDASLAVTRCVFTGNAARGVSCGEGGGMHIMGSSDVTIVNCTFSENFALEGGAMHLDTGVASATLINCLFHENDAIDHGGAIDVGSASPAFFDVINCTFVANTAGLEQGGAFHVEDPEVGQGPTVFITNSILWFNTPDQIEQSGGDITIRYTNFQGFLPAPWDGGDNISSVPIFDLGFRLADGSPGIDEGNNDDVLCDEFDLDTDGRACLPPDDEGTPDLDLINRVLDGLNNGTATVDMGSYEFINPFNCPWDLDGDGAVGVGDLLIMLANWGPNPGHPADFDGNDDVGVGDLLILLDKWGPCPAYSVEPPSLEEELADACLTEDDWDEFVDVLTDPETSQEDKDRYLCWMTHYLDHCPKCTCTHIPTCPSPDPFS